MLTSQVPLRLNSVATSKVNCLVASSASTIGRPTSIIIRKSSLDSIDSLKHLSKIALTSNDCSPDLS